MKVEGLDAADLKLALHALGVRASDAQVRAFLHRLDTDESGAVSLREFGRFVVGHQLAQGTEGSNDRR